MYYFVLVMVGSSHRVSVLFIVAVLLLVAGICVGEQTRLSPHLEVSEVCCGFTQCSMLAIGFFGLALWLAGTYLRPVTDPLVRSVASDPLSPPPELILFGSA